MATRQLRADAARSARVILAAAERVLSADPTASLEQIAEVAGVARTTIHRRFANRQALIDTLAVTAVEHLRAAIEAGRPETTPPLVALHQITANVLRTKTDWRFALGQPAPPGSEAAQGQQQIVRRCVELLARAQEQGALAADADLDWARRVYYALIGEAVHSDGAGTTIDPDLLASRVVETLLYGLGPRSGR